MLAFSVYGDRMSWTDWACLGIVILGFVLFLYGANFYDAVIGWVGVYLFFGGIIAFLVIYIYRELTKKEEVQNP
jgi:peptidoglycan/LPS O-acetylase OafA/YrhL